MNVKVFTVTFDQFNALNLTESTIHACLLSISATLKSALYLFLTRSHNHDDTVNSGRQKCC